MRTDTWCTDSGSKAFPVRAGISRPPLESSLVGAILGSKWPAFSGRHPSRFCVVGSARGATRGADLVPHRASVRRSMTSRASGSAQLPGADELRLLGMTGPEARMYRALCDGPRRAREAATIAGLQRATAYRVLSRLLERGLVLGDGRPTQHFVAVQPAELFRRLELFYREEAEIPGSLADSLGAPGRSAISGDASRFAVGRPRVLSQERGRPHPVFAELAGAKRSVDAIVRPLSTPFTFRAELEHTLGRLARSGIHVRILTDATPADKRFREGVARRAFGGPGSLELRHYSPVVSQFYSIDREKVVRIPTLHASSRLSPVGIATEGRVRIRPLIDRFETLWNDAAKPPLPSRRRAGQVGGRRRTTAGPPAEP